jgi:hypothetical protein
VLLGGAKEGQVAWLGSGVVKKKNKAALEEYHASLQASGQTLEGLSSNLVDAGHLQAPAGVCPYWPLVKAAPRS